MWVRLGPSGSLLCVQTYDQMGHFNVRPPYIIWLLKISVSVISFTVSLDSFFKNSIFYVNTVFVSKCRYLSKLFKTFEPIHFHILFSLNPIWKLDHEEFTILIQILFLWPSIRPMIYDMNVRTLAHQFRAQLKTKFRKKSLIVNFAQKNERSEKKIIFQLKLSFWRKITKDITRVDSRILTDSPYT